jgi:hypothetical protein
MLAGHFELQHLFSQQRQFHRDIFQASTFYILIFSIFTQLLFQAGHHKMPAQQQASKRCMQCVPKICYMTGIVNVRRLVL